MNFLCMNKWFKNHINSGWHTTMMMMMMWLCGLRKFYGEWGYVNSMHVTYEMLMMMEWGKSQINQINTENLSPFPQLKSEYFMILQLIFMCITRNSRIIWHWWKRKLQNVTSCNHAVVVMLSFSLKWKSRRKFFSRKLFDCIIIL